MKSQPNLEEIDFDVYDRIAPGEYIVYCREAALKRNPRFGQFCVFTLWDVLAADGSALATVPRWLYVGTRGGKAHAGKGTIFWRWWVQANGGRPPKRGDRMTPKIFVKRIARVLIADSQPPRARKGEPPPSHVPHSIVSQVVNWETGE